METKTEIIGSIYRTLVAGIRSRSASQPRQWLAQRGLTIEGSLACFNSGLIHWRKPQQRKDELESVGFLKKAPVPSSNGQTPYLVFADYSVAFPLRDANNEVVNFFAIGIKDGKTAFLNEEGIYPAFPSATTKKLFLAENTLDAATILESKVLGKDEAVISLFEGRLMAQHREAILRLKELKQIILMQ